MLTMPVDSQPFFNVVGIDPGTHKLGVGVLSVEFGTFKVLSSTAYTVTALKEMPKDAWSASMHGERAARIYTLCGELERCFNFYRPLRIACESPFFNPRQPMAFGALVEILAAIRRTVWMHDKWQHLYLYDPPSVKNAVGAKGNADKDAMRARVTAMAVELNWNGPHSIDLLDEHAFDGLAVACAELKNFKELSCLN